MISVSHKNMFGEMEELFTFSTAWENDHFNHTDFHDTTGQEVLDHLHTFIFEECEELEKSDEVHFKSIDEAIRHCAEIYNVDGFNDSDVRKECIRILSMGDYPSPYLRSVYLVLLRDVLLPKLESRVNYYRSFGRVLVLKVGDRPLTLTHDVDRYSKFKRSYDTEPEEPLIEAIHLGDIDALRRLTSESNCKRYPLSVECAIRQGNNDALKVLLLAGADPNGCTEVGHCRHLHTSIRLSNSQAVKLLVDYGADLRICDINGVTPLMLAALHGNRKIVQILLSSPRASVNDMNTHGWCQKNALHIACEHGHLAIAKNIIETCGDLGVTTLNNTMKTPRMLMEEYSRMAGL